MISVLNCLDDPIEAFPFMHHHCFKTGALNLLSANVKLIHWILTGRGKMMIFPQMTDTTAVGLRIDDGFICV